MNAFPWARAMELGLGQLGLAPDEFWRMTLPELSAAAKGAGVGAAQSPIGRADLDQLCTAYPDAANKR